VTRVRRSLAHVHNGRRGAGSGTIWHADGLIVTNAHVVGHGPVKVELQDDRTFPAQILTRDAAQDLAALRLQGTGIADLPTIQAIAFLKGAMVRH
jgi:serine protease Do